MLVAGLAVPAAAQDPGDGQECWQDPPGDVAAYDDEDLSDDPAVDEPRADIVEFCVTTGAQHAFTMSLTEPTDPDTDASWEQQAMATWTLFTNDDPSADFVIEVFRHPDTGRAHAQVVDARGTTDDVMCTPEVQATGEGLRVTGVESDQCLDGAQDLRAEAGFFLFSDDGVLAYDHTTQWGSGDPSKYVRRTQRLAGGTRTETSVAISQAQFADPADATTVYLARNDVFADAAVGGALTDGPILIVPSCGETPEAVSDEIGRLDVETVIALGGDAAICQELLADAADGRDDARLGGATRFETAVQIAQAAHADPDRVYLARSDEFIDAVTGGTLTDGPILLVPSCGAVPDAVQEAVAEFDPDEVVTLGGDVAICDATLAEAADGRATGRFAGDDRYHTAVLVSQYQFAEPGGDRLYLARADLPVDALAGGVLTDGPILTVPSCGVDIDTAAFDALAREISRQSVDTIVALGGSVAICDDILAQAAAF